MAKRRYTVGYGKPPPETRFRPGVSGNPKGRPKGSKNLSTIIQQELEAEILITEGGRQSKVTKREALVKTIIAKGLGGDIKAANAVLQLDSLSEEREAAQKPIETITDEDQDILKAYKNRLDASTAPEEPTNEDNTDEPL